MDGNGETGWANNEGVTFSQFSGGQPASEKEKEEMARCKGGEKGKRWALSAASCDDPLTKLNMRLDHLKVKVDRKLIAELEKRSPKDIQRA